MLLPASAEDRVTQHKNNVQRAEVGEMVLIRKVYNLEISPFLAIQGCLKHGSRPRGSTSPNAQDHRLRTYLETFQRQQICPAHRTGVADTYCGHAREVCKQCLCYISKAFVSCTLPKVGGNLLRVSPFPQRCVVISLTRTIFKNDAQGLRSYVCFSDLKPS